MNPLTPYMAWIKLGAFVAICAGCYVYGGSNAKARAELRCAERDNERLELALLAFEIAQREREKAEAELDRLAKLPPKVVTVVRNNPSKCDLPRPVTDAARVQVNDTNEAIRKHNRSVR